MTPLEDYASLALFARVVHHRSFSAAAREAGIAKSAVSRRVAKLESDLGVRLLQRSTRALAVTDDGLRVFAHCAALVAAAAAAHEAADGRAGAARGIVRVGAPFTFAQLHLTRAIADFLPRHPEVEVHLALDNRVVDMIEGGFDVVIRIGRLAPSELVARRLAKDRLVVCGSPAYLAQHGEPRQPDDLAQHECIHYSLVDRDAEWRFRGGPRLPTRGRFVASDGTALKDAAVAGVGLAVVPFFMVARDVAEGRLRLVLEGARRAEIGIYAVTAHRTNVPARTRALLDFLARRFAKVDWATA
jgi:DNA-binding transcriptional LysR family regulator